MQDVKASNCIARNLCRNLSEIIKLLTIQHLATQTCGHHSSEKKTLIQHRIDNETLDTSFENNQNK